MEKFNSKKELVQGYAKMVATRNIQNAAAHGSLQMNMFLYAAREWFYGKKEALNRVHFTGTMHIEPLNNAYVIDLENGKTWGYADASNTRGYATV